MDEKEQSPNEEKVCIHEESSGSVHSEIRTEVEESLELVEEEFEKSGEPEIYGVSIPEPVMTSSTEFLHLTSDSELDDNDGSSDTISHKDGEISMADIYKRKQRQSGFPDDPNETELLEEETKVLPVHPFWDNLFIPFFTPGFILRLLIMMGAAFLPFFLGTKMFIRLLEKHYIPEGENLSSYAYCIIHDPVILFLFCFLWGIFSLPYLMYIFEATSNGDDRMEDWPEYNVIAGIGQFFWFAILTIIAGSTGYFLFMILGLPDQWGFAISTLLLLPVFLLSVSETDTLFMLATKTVLKSFTQVRKAWCIFYIWALVLFTLTIFIAIIALWTASRSDGAFNIVALVALVISFLFSIIPAIYLRLLGRLGWIISDEARKQAQLKEKSEKE